MKAAGIRRIIAASMSAILLLGVVPGVSAEKLSGSLKSSAGNVENKDTSYGVFGLISYKNWKKSIGNAKTASASVIAKGADYTYADGAELCTQQGVRAVKTDSSSNVEWHVQVPENGFYNLTIRYCPVASKSGFTSSIERSVTINGKIPYQECSYIEFARSYCDVGTADKDSLGNDIRRTQEEVTEFQDYTVCDPSGFVAENLCFYLTAGENSVGLKAIKGDMLIEWLKLSNAGTAMPYKEYLDLHNSEPDASADTKPLVIQGETPSSKSNFTIVSVYDRSSPNTQPSSTDTFLLNTIGGNNWSTVGQKLSWDIKAEKSGYYTITLRFKQDIYSGTISSRRLLIDGKVPFKEAEALEFPYKDGWQTGALSAGGEQLKFYLEAGRHTLTLQAVLGDMAGIIEQVNSALSNLNNDYLRILTYTGAIPDIYRDYSFDTLLPDVIKDMALQRDALKSASKALKSLLSKVGQNTAVLDQTSYIITKMVTDPDDIARHFRAFKDDLSAIGTWLTTYSTQPLQIDTIRVQSAFAKIPVQKESAINDFWFQCRILCASFIQDYNAVGSVITGREPKRKITVWTATGRDQSEITQRLADELFTPESGIKVNLKLVAAGSLLPNILSGNTVDVYLSAGISDPVNYAIRGAVKDITQFSDFNEVTSQFNKTAMLPFTYRGKAYALPETLSFPVLFYRKDVFKRLEVTAPKTWDEFYAVISALQKNNMTVGIEWLNAYKLFLYQNGGSFYNKDFTASSLDSNESMWAFKKTAELYTTYGLPVEFSFANRFRSGEMPMGIMDYTLYNQLTVFAPEIKGLWGISLVPGTIQKDGSINHTTPTNGTAIIMPRTVSDTDAAWKFMKWWTRANVQSRYGVEMETVLGASARQASANLNAVANLPWSASEFAVLKEQWQYLQATPEIPGSYYTARMLDFAFNSVYSLQQDPIEALEENAVSVNEEISRKLEEFNAFR